MNTNREVIETIHASLVNGQRRQMVDQINECVLYDFWSDYLEYLKELYYDTHAHLQMFSDCVISYHRITS